MRYLFTNEILNAVLSATNGNSNYPVANLQDRFLQKRFQSTGEISQITSLMNTVADVNCIAHGHTNATSIYSYLYGAGQFIGQEYTNLITDPCDLTTANWTEHNGLTAHSTTLSINGLSYTKLLCDGTIDPQLDHSAVTVAPSVKHTGSIIINRGNSQYNPQLFLLLSGENNACTINWTTKIVQLNTGDQVKYNFIDDDTAQVWLTTIGGSTDTSLSYRIDPPTDSLNGEYIYATACMLNNDTTTIFPFVDGTHAADAINETFTMPDKFAIDMIIEPKFAYDITSNVYFFKYYISSTQYLSIYYRSGSDHFRIEYQDNGAIRSIMFTQQFDDGSDFVDINQRIRLIGFINTTTGDTTGSSLICILLESGVLSEDISWDQNVDPMVSDFSNAYIGWDGAGNQANSDIESLRIYDWDGVKPTITSSADVDNYFADRTPSFEFEPDDVLFKESVVHNLNSDTDMTYFDKLAIKQIVTTIEGPDPVYLGGLGAGEYYQMPDPEEGFALPLKDNSHYEQSPSGQVLSNYEEPLEAPEFTFKGVSNGVANEIKSEYIEIGKGYPFYADFFEYNRDFYSPLYCFFTEAPGDVKNSRRRDYSVKLLEAR